MTDLAVSEYWDNCYSNGIDFKTSTHLSITRLLSYVHEDSSKLKVLDIGCGTGQLCRELWHRGLDVTGVDVSPAAIKIAKRITGKGLINYQVIDVETELNNLPHSHFNLITCKLVYAFIRRKSEFVSEIKTNLLLGGTFVVITPLLTDVPPDKKNIAVDFEQTLHELKQTFENVETYEEQGLSYFICK